MAIGTRHSVVDNALLVSLEFPQKSNAVDRARSKCSRRCGTSSERNVQFGPELQPVQHLFQLSAIDAAHTVPFAVMPDEENSVACIALLRDDLHAQEPQCSNEAVDVL